MLQPNNLLLITVDNYNTILLITQGTAETTVAHACNSQNICSVQKQLLRLVVV